MKPHFTPSQISSTICAKETKIWTECHTNIYKYVFNIIICLGQMDKKDGIENVGYRMKCQPGLSYSNQRNDIMGSKDQGWTKASLAYLCWLIQWQGKSWIPKVWGVILYTSVVMCDSLRHSKGGLPWTRIRHHIEYSNFTVCYVYNPSPDSEQ